MARRNHERASRQTDYRWVRALAINTARNLSPFEAEEPTPVPVSAYALPIFQSSLARRGGRYNGALSL